MRKRKTYSDGLLESATEIALFLRQDIETAMRLPPSHVDSILKTAAFRSWKEAQEQRQKLDTLLFGRLDGISRQISALTKNMASRR